MPRICGSPTRQVVEPALEPSFVTAMVTLSPPGSAATLAMPPVNGPMPLTARRAMTASTTTATATPTNTVPCACDADGCLRPSGLHRSHIASDIGMRAPHLTQPWSGSSVAAGRTEGVGVIASRLQAGLEDPDVGGAGRVPVAAGVAQRLARAEAVEIRGEAADHVQDDGTDP